MLPDGMPFKCAMQVYIRCTLIGCEAPLLGSGLICLCIAASSARSQAGRPGAPRAELPRSARRAAKRMLTPASLSAALRPQPCRHASLQLLPGRLAPQDPRTQLQPAAAARVASLRPGPPPRAREGPPASRAAACCQPAAHPQRVTASLCTALLLPDQRNAAQTWSTCWRSSGLAASST